MYTNLYGCKNLKSRYGKGVMPVSVEKVRTYVLHTSNDVKKADGRSHHPCILCVVFN